MIEKIEPKKDARSTLDAKCLIELFGNSTEKGIKLSNSCNCDGAEGPPTNSPYTKESIIQYE